MQEELRDCIERRRPLDLAPDFGTSAAGAGDVTAKPHLFGPETIDPSYSLSSVSSRNRRLTSRNGGVYFLLMFRSNGFALSIFVKGLVYACASGGVLIEFE